MTQGKDLKIRLKIDLPGGVRLGYGKVDLLRAVAREASISAAARTMGMSYRRAWLLIDELNKSFASPVIETRIGGKAHGGATLTDMGERIIALYLAAEEQARVAMAQNLDDLARCLVPASASDETDDL
ncbi:winged helix-turn-helix domain-containing protein [Thalassospira sp. TSL5-1]|uniref:winged helix-turn-helix domain-containing protein n=1 Tax=Thalassospira sp. TSL5-1 TaxID=1544451 RepID=UPI00093ABE98|nr:winged helix-turn-helix domain-containing protein [Thalassospira sp. TSL5-1]OKH88157.1 transcriptional regulator [Thalassospira sp. TSL5-1]